MNRAEKYCVGALGGIALLLSGVQYSLAQNANKIRLTIDAFLEQSSPRISRSFEHVQPRTSLMMSTEQDVVGIKPAESFSDNPKGPYSVSKVGSNEPRPSFNVPEDMSKIDYRRTDILHTDRELIERFPDLEWLVKNVRADSLMEEVRAIDEGSSLYFGKKQRFHGPSEYNVWLEKYWPRNLEGEKIAEIGPGTGYLAHLLSSLVGPEGKVSFHELDPRAVELIMYRLSKEDSTYHDRKQFEVVHSRMAHSGVKGAKVVFMNRVHSWTSDMPFNYNRLSENAFEDDAVNYFREIYGGMVSDPEDPARLLIIEHSNARYSSKDVARRVEAAGFSVKSIEEFPDGGGAYILVAEK